MNTRFSTSQSLPARSLTIHHLPDLAGFHYHLRLAEIADPSRVLVAVHGISRQSELMIRWLGEAADKQGYTILAPHFSQKDFNGYQRLGGVSGGRADAALMAMLADAERFLPGLGYERICLFGFSGGAQFAHRFTLLHGGRVAALVLAAAGWYTPLDSRLNFPWGLRQGRRFKGARFSARALLSTPILTAVGVNDVLQDSALRRDPRIDAREGTHRKARAHWWFRHVQKGTQKLGLAVNHEFRLLPGTGHDFDQAVLRGGLDRHLFDFCERNRERKRTGG